MLRNEDDDSDGDDLRTEEEMTAKKKGKLVTTAMIKTWSKGLQVCVGWNL